MKLAIVGAGSTYTPELVDGLIRMRGLLPVDDLALMDTDEERLAILGAMTQRMLGRGGYAPRLTRTTSLDEAVEGADAVLIQLRVGGQAARRVDESLPLACGCIGQETTGFGGLAKALRTVPVVLGIADRVRALAPHAWVVDFTNPVGIVTKALLDAGHRAVGLCSAAMVFQRHFAKVLEVEPERIELDHVGLNHLTWEIAVRLDGEDVLAELTDEHADRVAPATGLPPDLVRRLGVVPSYYLHYFYDHDDLVEHHRTHESRAEEVTAIEAELLHLYADESVTEKPELLSRRGGAYYAEAAVELLASLLGTSPNARHVVNLRNGGTLPFLADDAVVEVPARVGTLGRADRDAAAGPRGARLGGSRLGLRGPRARRGASRGPRARVPRPPCSSPDRPAAAGREAHGPAARREPYVPAVGVTRVVAAGLVVCTGTACGSGERAPTREVRLPVPFMRAPPSLAHRCSVTARAVGYAVPCPTMIPRGLVPTEAVGPCARQGWTFHIVGLPCPPPGPWKGWVVGSSEVAGVPRQHLVIMASPRPIRDYAKVVNGPAWYPRARVEVDGWTTVRGRRIRWMFVPPATNEGSAFAGHVVLVWTTGGHTYAVGFHDATTRCAARAMDLELARHLRMVRP